MKIRHHYIELEGDAPFAAVRTGDTLHLLINARAVLAQPAWVREALLDKVSDLGLEPLTPATQRAKVIHMDDYLTRYTESHDCHALPSKTKVPTGGK